MNSILSRGSISGGTSGVRQIPQDGLLGELADVNRKYTYCDNREVAPGSVAASASLAEMALGRSAVAHVVKRSVELGHTRRERCATDKRCNHLDLMHQAEALVSLVVVATEEWDVAPASTIPDEESGTLVTLPRR